MSVCPVLSWEIKQCNVLTQHSATKGKERCHKDLQMCMMTCAASMVTSYSRQSWNPTNHELWLIPPAGPATCRPPVFWSEWVMTVASTSPPFRFPPYTSGTCVSGISGRQSCAVCESAVMCEEESQPGQAFLKAPDKVEVRVEQPCIWPRGRKANLNKLLEETWLSVSFKMSPRQVPETRAKASTLFPVDCSLETFYSNTVGNCGS